MKVKNLEESHHTLMLGPQAQSGTPVRCTQRKQLRQHRMRSLVQSAVWRRSTPRGEETTRLHISSRSDRLQIARRLSTLLQVMNEAIRSPMLTFILKVLHYLQSDDLMIRLRAQRPSLSNTHRVWRCATTHALRTRCSAKLHREVWACILA